MELNLGGIAHIENRDNFEFVPDGSIDFILTDPPFNVSQKTNFHTYEKNTIHSYKFDKEGDWDTYTHEQFLEIMDQWALNFARVLRKGGNFAIFCADSYLSHFMDSLKKAGLSPRRVFTWRKPNAVPINRAYMATSAVEYVITGVKGNKAVFNADVPVTTERLDTKLIESVLVADKAASIVDSVVKSKILNGAYSTDNSRVKEISDDVIEAIKGSEKAIRSRVEAMWKEDADGNKYLQGCVPNHVSFPLKTGKRIHSTEKPVILLEYFLALYSKPGELVLDPFGGSASTGEASLRNGRKVILTERDKEYYEKGKARLSALIDG